MKESTQTEMLAVSRKRVQELYDALQSEQERKDLELYNQVSAEDRAAMLFDLFGSKCLPDEEQIAENANCKEPKPAEPRFEAGDMVIYKRTGKKKVVFGTDKYGRYCVTLPNMQSPMYVDESDLEPYTEPKEDHIVVNNEMVKDFDTIIKDSFSKERRLNIAAMAMQGILSNADRMKQYGEIAAREPESLTEIVVRNALRYADALIAEAEKGDKDGED